MYRTLPALMCLILATLPGSVIAELTENSDTTFKPLDLFSLQWVKEPRISPDGSKIAYTRHRFDIMSDQERSNLWLIDSNGENHQPLNDSDIQSSMPRWAPDGERLAYVSNAGGSPQIHIHWLKSGRDIAITQLQAPPKSLTWSADGQYLAFSQFVTRDAKPIGKPVKKPEGAEWNADAKVFEDSFYRADSSGFNKPGRSQLFLINAEGGAAIQLTDTNFLHQGKLSFSPDGRYIYYSGNQNSNWQIDRAESDIFRLDILTREITKITDRDGPDTKPTISPDGKWLAYLGSDDVKKYQDAKIYLSPIANHAPMLLLDLDKPVNEIRWAANSRSLYFSYIDQSVSRIGHVDLKGKVTEIASNLGGSAIGRPYANGNFTVSNNGVLAHDVSSSKQPANLAVTRGRKSQQLTNLNRDLVAYRDISDVEEIWFESSFDKLPIQGWLVKPPGFDPLKKYPLILEIHGGPYAAYGNYFSAEVQLYASAGYVVLYTNPRGSTSYGVEFARKIHHDYPGNDYHDLMSGVDSVIGLGYIDEDNLFVTGGSGGGILTAWIVTQTHRFKAAVAQKPVINWYTLTLNSDIGPYFWPFFFSSLPWDEPEAYLAKSPISRVNKVRTPTMLLTGEQDWRTPMSESEQFYQGLQLNGVDTALVRIQNSGHSISKKPSNLLRKVGFVTGWFDRYRLGSEKEN